MTERERAIECIDHVDPARLDYDEWLSVGMALKDVGCTAADWDVWSRRDTQRYKDGECWRKWDSFRGSGKPVTVASIVQLAKHQGWTPPGRRLDAELEWDSEIGGWDEQAAVIDPNWVQDVDVVEPGDEWQPVQELITYLGTLFASDEHVAFVTESWYNEKAERYLPKKGVWDRTAGELIEELQICDGNISLVVGDWQPEVGAWIRFNPVDGTGIRDENVTSYRYALIESDEIPIPRQYALLKELELPIAAMVHSGGKSLHAIVRVDADSYDDYRKRVDYLYDVCKRNGLQLDRQNRNPSRLSRMPGVMRGERKQYLVATNIGKRSWQEWREWIEDLNDDLPDIEGLEVGTDEPELAPELIAGVLREGHKLLLAGPSKAGKSFALAQLCIAMSEGGTWFGWKVARGRVLYVNLELDHRSCRHRFWKIYRELGTAQTPGMLDVWNLRGNATAMDKLAPKLIRRAQQARYKAIIIDPIYKVITGDENSAAEMAHFCNQFDKICVELGAATIYCHHHSKGAQGQKNSRDRSSGSGVFSRDPDAILDMIELRIDEDRRKVIENREVCDTVASFLNDHSPDWRDTIGQDTAIVEKEFITAAGGLLDAAHSSAMSAAVFAARKRVATMSGWRLEGTVREFPAFPPMCCFFRYPVHVPDADNLLADAKAEGEEPPWTAKRKAKKKSNEDRKKERLEALETAYGALGIDESVTVEGLAEYMGISEKTARRRIKEHPGFDIDDGDVTRTSGTEGHN